MLPFVNRITSDVLRVACIQYLFFFSSSTVDLTLWYYAVYYRVIIIIIPGRYRQH